MQKSQVADGGVNVGIKSLEKTIKTDRRKHSGEKSGWISQILQPTYGLGNLTRLDKLV